MPQTPEKTHSWPRRSFSPALGLAGVLAAAWLLGGLGCAPDPTEAEAPLADASDRPHLLLVVIDTLRADHLGAYGYPRPTSPRIDALAREGVRFARARAPSSWTLPSVASLFTSRLPSEHGATAWGKPIDPRIPTLPERLRDAGYTTVGVSGNFVHVTQHTGFDRGFDHWSSRSIASDRDDPQSLFSQKFFGQKMGFRAPTAFELNADVAAGLPAAGSDPLFLYVHYMEPHSGYDPPAEQRDGFVRDAAVHAAGAPATSRLVTDLARGERSADPAERARLVDLYDGEIATADAALGELLDLLRERGFAESLVVVVVSDHGEAFGDHGTWFHGNTLHAEALDVPFILWDSRHRGGGEVRDEPVDLLDVPTTLLALAGVPRDRELRGRRLSETRGPARDLRAFLDTDPRFEESVGPRVQRRAVTRWPWKWIVDLDGSARVYRVDRDPGERMPLDPADAQVPDWVRPEIAALAADARQAALAAAEPTQPDVSDPELERLRALGYAR